MKTPRELDETTVREFRLWLNRQPGVSGDLKKKTQNYYLIALRAFLKYLRKQGIESLNPERIELAKVSARDLDLITSAELERLMSGPDGSSLASLRDRAYWSFFLHRIARLGALQARSRPRPLARRFRRARQRRESARGLPLPFRQACSQSVSR